jgi:trimeric autotransporter adhesin
MAKQTVNVGTSASDGTGDDLRVAFTKVNENFTELYSGNVQVTAANILVYSVAGRTGNVVLTVNDVAQAASKSYVNTAIASNLANVTGSITNSINANVTAANAVISNHAARITTLESNAAAQSTAITSLQNTRATTSYVDTSINLALSSNAVLANVASVNANVAAANLAIAGKASLTGAIFSGNAQASWVIANTGVRVGNTIIVGSSSESTTFPATPNLGAFFAGDTRIGGSLTKYYQIRAQNLDPDGSTDLVLAADDVTSTNNYVAFGVAGSTYNDITYPDIQPHDAYLLSGNSNLVINSLTQRVQILTNFVKRFEVDQAGMVRLLDGARLEFPDGTIQSTAFGGNTNVTAINANITAANVAIAALQSNAASQALDINSLYANAGTQATSINVLIANAATQSQSLNTLTGNISTLFANAVTQDSSIITLISNAVSQNSSLLTLTANAAAQALDINNLFSNAATQQTTIDTLVSNAATQAASLTTLTANAATQTDLITALTANAATQAASLTTLTANAATQAASLTTLTANAAAQALDINNLYSNLTIYVSNVQTINSNVAAANTQIQVLNSNLGTATTNITTLFSNAASQAVSINSINANISAANVNINTKANITGQIFNGNVQASYLLANANVKIGSIIEVGNTNPINYPGLGGVFVGNVDGYYQVAIQNLSNGTQASGDFVITADDGDDETNYLNIGINSSGWSGNYTVPAGDTGVPQFPHDGYMNVIGGNAIVFTDSNLYLVANTAVAGLNKDGDFFVSANISAVNVNVTGNINYTPNTAGNYNQTITNMQKALDELAARVKALGG